MRKRTMWITGAASAAVILGGASIAVGATQQARDLRVGTLAGLAASIGSLDDDSDGPALTDADRAMASSAALAKVGQGTVTEVERDDDSGAAYEVEVRLTDGTQVEVALGADFQVVSQSAPEHDDD
ncbi:PepSY domain-containing protein [Arthrobacter sp. NPDC058130]|uniref:PepSY domain-containing protein n=1 Tax=Arthrobacter sp. NPDC058130 TaxID=3346353 RepID=UPI0036E9C818